MFKWKPAPQDRGEALRIFRTDLAKAIEAARFAHVDARTLADLLGARADQLRRDFAISAPIRSAL